MGQVKWTDEQLDAIFRKDSNILVAAAAGSGKTAVLVERIINKIINEKVDIDKLLVVTFTNAAASEMRQRVLSAIYDKLEEEPDNINLQRQITLLNKASICTIDSFCLEVVRNNFYELDNVSPNFRIADTTEIELLKQEVIEELFEKKYEEENKEFNKLINTYTGYRDDAPLKEMILKIYSYIQSNPFPEKWLNEKIEIFNISDTNEDFAKNRWGKILVQEIEEEVIDNILTLEKVKKELAIAPDLHEFYLTIVDDIDKLNELKKASDSWDKIYEISNNIKFTTWPRKKIDSDVKENAKQTRDEIKIKFKKTIQKNITCNSKEANQDILDMYENLVNLKDIILEFGKIFSSK